MIKDSLLLISINEKVLVCLSLINAKTNKDNIMKDLDKEQKEYVVELITYFHKHVRIEGSYTLGHWLNSKGLLEEEFKEGEWYKGVSPGGNTFLIKYTGRFTSGIFNNEWKTNLSFDIDYIKACNNVVELTPSEVEKALRKEGDKYIGKTVKCLYDGKEYVVEKFMEFQPRHNVLWYEDGDTSILLMKDGVWAEVVEQEKKMTKEVEQCTTMISMSRDEQGDSRVFINDEEYIKKPK